MPAQAADGGRDLRVHQDPLQQGPAQQRVLPRLPHLRGAADGDGARSSAREHVEASPAVRASSRVQGNTGGGGDGSVLSF